MPTWLKRKKNAAALVFGAFAGLLWVMFAPNAETEDPEICGRNASELMDSIPLESTASMLLDDFGKKRIRYGILHETGSLPDTERAGKPFEIVATLKKTGFIVGRKETLVLGVDARGLITKKSCRVFFTGP